MPRGGLVPPIPKSRQKLSMKYGLRLVGYTFRLKNNVKIPPPRVSQMFQSWRRHCQKELLRQPEISACPHWALGSLDYDLLKEIFSSYALLQGRSAVLVEICDKSLRDGEETGRYRKQLSLNDSCSNCGNGQFLQLEISAKHSLKTICWYDFVYPKFLRIWIFPRV